jgi:hypothetical protein
MLMIRHVLLCADNETIHHLFFEYCVSKIMWQLCSEISGKQLGADFESVAKFWLQDKKIKCLNVFTTAVFWTVWKFRNEMCFQGRMWSGMKVLFGRCARTIRDWMLVQKPEDVLILGGWLEQLEAAQTRPPALTWDPGALLRNTRLPDELGGDPVWPASS